MKNLNVGTLGLNDMTGVARQVIFDLVYPIGSYISIDNPDFDTVAKVEAYYGGHWEQVVDKVLYGVANNGGVDEGSNTITLTTSQLPNHSHSFNGNAITGSVGGSDIESFHFRGSKIQSGALSLSDWNYTKYCGASSGADGYTAKTINFNATPSGSISSTGSGEAIDIRGARRRVYIYHRIS